MPEAVLRLAPEPYQRCCGYSNGCPCTRCQARSEGVEKGVLYYDSSGRLRYKPKPQAVNAQAVVAYMRDRQAKASRLAA